MASPTGDTKLLTLLLVLLSLLTPRAGSSQGRMEILKPRLEVKKFSGDFTQWVTILNVTSPQVLTFRWSTDDSQATSATWHVSEKPYGESRVPYLSSGSLSEVPPKGKFATFQIDLRSLLKKGSLVIPPKLWVYVVAKGARGGPGAPSAPVQIEYGKASQPPLDLSDTPAEKPVTMNIPAPAGMGHYCSMAFPNGTWAFVSYPNGGDPCADIMKKTAGGTIQRAGLYSATGINRVVGRCSGGYVGTYAGAGNGPLTAAFNAAQGRSGCFFAVAPKALPIFSKPFDSNGVTHGTGFDFAKPPYEPVDVSTFGQSGSSAATIINNRGQERSSKFIDNHDAHDISMPRKTPLYAVADGVVLSARKIETGCTGTDSSVQNEIYITHTVTTKPLTYREKFIAAYFHLSSNVVTSGATVKAGEVVGYSGHTGCSSHPHLHFAVLRLTNTARKYLENFQLFGDARNNNGASMVIDPYGFDSPTGFDPWAWRAYDPSPAWPNGAGALSISLWKSGQAPPLGNW